MDAANLLPILLLMFGGEDQMGSSLGEVVQLLMRVIIPKQSKHFGTPMGKSHSNSTSISPPTIPVLTNILLKLIASIMWWETSHFFVIQLSQLLDYDPVYDDFDSGCLLHTAIAMGFTSDETSGVDSQHYTRHLDSSSTKLIG